MWKLHRLVLRSGSGYFDTLCKGEGFKESGAEKVDLQEMDPNVVGMMLKFLYTYDYDHQSGAMSPLETHVHVYAAADRFDIPLLKDRAKEKFAAALENASTVESFLYVINAVYKTTPSSDRGLRDCLIPKLQEFKEQLRNDDTFMTSVRTLAEGDLAVDVIDTWAGFAESATVTNSKPASIEYFWFCTNCQVTAFRGIFLGRCDNCDDKVFECLVNDHSDQALAGWQLICKMYLPTG